MNPVDRLKSLVAAFSKRRILVIGDVGIDRYVTGDVERISPEAPVPVVFVKSEIHKLGLAANVADNLHALDAESDLIGVIGEDRFASEVRSLLRREKVSDRGLVVDPARRTIVKERIVSDRQQLLRIDYESPEPVSAAIEKQILASVKRLLSGARAKKAATRVDGLIVQDYAKGMLSLEVIAQISKLAKAAKVPVFMDPNAKSTLDLYTGATFLTPNAKEAAALSGVAIRDHSSLKSAGSKLLKGTGAEFVVITLGKDGMAIFTKGSREPEMIPTFAREVYDVSGAGDTVISIMALAYASGATIREAAILGNLGAGVVVAKRGTATCTPEELNQAMKAAVTAGLLVAEI
ncbi:MAG: bifunctional hydroxymethylpyrimidine kinase/phosphomethylpyrimidine kinase [Cryobacterium sp.]|nr:bifunctional hydroxymethylpyrimidine kinase/phosphomethylpyrimidine kinase [Oligoflexia bacterium]